MKKVPESCLAGIGTPTICCAKIQKYTAEQKYDVTGPFIPFSPFQGKLKKFAFLYRYTMKSVLPIPYFHLSE